MGLRKFAVSVLLSASLLTTSVAVQAAPAFEPVIAAQAERSGAQLDEANDQFRGGRPWFVIFIIVAAVAVVLYFLIDALSEEDDRATP